MLWLCLFANHDFEFCGENMGKSVLSVGVRRIRRFCAIVFFPSRSIIIDKGDLQFDLSHKCLAQLPQSNLSSRAERGTIVHASRKIFRGPALW